MAKSSSRPRIDYSSDDSEGVPSHSSSSAIKEDRSKTSSNSSVAATMDSAEREKALADQLRRRALASKTSSSRKEQPRPSSRSPSRTPPSDASQPSPPPRPTKRRSRSRSRSVGSRISARSTASRKRPREEDRHRERQRRRSGRDSRDPEYEDRSRHADSNGHGGDGYRYMRGESRYSQDRSRRRESRARDTDDEDDDTRSHQSGYSHQGGSREVGYPARRELVDRDAPPPPRSGRRDPYDYDDYYRRPASRDYHSPAHYDRPAPRHRRGPSPVRRSPTPDPEDYELRSIFCSQLAARMTQRDLGEYFEEKLGEGTVKDVRIVADRSTGRSKGIGYVELISEAVVEQAIQCTGEVLFGIPILVQKTDAARNRGEGASTAQAPIRPNLPMIGGLNALPKIDPTTLSSLPLPPHLLAAGGQAIHLGASLNVAPKVTDNASRLYVGSLHFDLVDQDVKAVFEPFGEIDHVDLHREPLTNKSKGFAFVQYKRAEDAEKAIESMNGFELAGRNIRVGHVNARGQDGKSTSQQQSNGTSSDDRSSGNTAQATSSFDEGGGGGLNAYSRANLMQMLARTEGGASNAASQPAEQIRPANIPEATSKAIILKNMFNPAEETERDWDQDLAADVKEECETKYGKVQRCHVDKDSTAGEIYLEFNEVDGATKAIAGLNGRWFGGRPVSAGYISQSFLTARLG